MKETFKKTIDAKFVKIQQDVKRATEYTRPKESLMTMDDLFIHEHVKPKLTF